MRIRAAEVGLCLVVVRGVLSDVDCGLVGTVGGLGYGLQSRGGWGIVAGEKVFMGRFTVRDMVWLVAVVVVGTGVFVTRSRRENDSAAVVRRASEQELEAIGARYRAAKGEFDWYASHRDLVGDRWSLDTGCGVIERFAYAAETSNELETRVKDLASVLELAQYLAAIAQDKVEKDLEPEKTIHRTQYTQADIELRLRRAKEDLAAGRATK